jgi:hypothetical protein
VVAGLVPDRTLVYEVTVMDIALYRHRLPYGELTLTRNGEAHWTLSYDRKVICSYASAQAGAAGVASGRTGERAIDTLSTRPKYLSEWSW